MHDIVIRGGSIVDGTGAPASQGDVAIDGDRIVQVGGKAGPGRREVKADGRIVTPGWVDVHTHYDGQATGIPSWRRPPGTAPRPSPSAIAAWASPRFANSTRRR